MKKTKLCITLTVAVFINTALFSQDHEHDWPCHETVHGIIDNIHMDCDDEEILITSLSEDLNGTIINGVITISDTILGGITIKPGYSFVIIEAVKGTNDELHGSTKIGNNGNMGRFLDKNKTKGIPEIMVYPNTTKDFITIRSASSKITNYQITNYYGRLIKKEKLLLTNNTKLSVLDLKKGIYLLSILLENGTQQTKTIIKN